jgi:hypothetical protein
MFPLKPKAWGGNIGYQQVTKDLDTGYFGLDTSPRETATPSYYPPDI